MSDVAVTGPPASRSRGHVFVVHGKIESVVHDVAIVSVGDEFAFSGSFDALLGTRQPAEPEGWPGTGFARSVERDDVWYVSVGGQRGLPVEDLVRRVREAVVAAAGFVTSTKGTRRVRPLVALPFVGLGGGGHHHHRGDVIRQLVRSLTEAAHERAIDVVLVTPDGSVHAAAQHVRRDLADRDGATYEKAAELGRRAARGELALFLGGGVSIPAGLPTWTELIEELAGHAEHLVQVDISRLNVLDQAELVQAGDPGFPTRVAAIIDRRDRPSLAHALLAGLRCREVVTTNYDRLYEKAVEAAERQATSVLPHSSAVGAGSWVLKMHGDVGSPESIVLTRRHFVQFDATTRPAGALLQTLLLTRHLLFVGASLTDDNVVRLMHEVQAYREHHGLPGQMGALLDVDADRARQVLWRDQLDWIEMDGGSLEERARSLEVFLDRVAMYASEDTSWLLDPRFAGLLEDEDEKQLARRSRDLYRSIGERGGAWEPLRRTLDELGAAR